MQIYILQFIRFILSASWLAAGYRSQAKASSQQEVWRWRWYTYACCYRCFDPCGLPYSAGCCILLLVGMGSSAPIPHGCTCITRVNESRLGLSDIHSLAPDSTSASSICLIVRLYLVSPWCRNLRTSHWWRNWRFVEMAESWLPAVPVLVDSACSSGCAVCALCWILRWHAPLLLIPA